MTTRERAIGWLQGLCVGPHIGTNEADLLVRRIESAGITIVDRELHEALVAAVRAYQWREAYAAAHRWSGSRELENEAFDRAVALLAEEQEEG